MGGQFVEREVWDKVIEQTAIICDVCGVKVEGDNWERDEFEVAETVVDCRVGSVFPGEGHGDFYTIDICPKCFVEKLVPWVESHGRGAIQPTKWDV